MSDYICEIESLTVALVCPDIATALSFPCLSSVVYL